MIFISFYYLYLMSSMDQSANKKPTDPMIKTTGYFCEKHQHSSSVDFLAQGENSN